MLGNKKGIKVTKCGRSAHQLTQQLDKKFAKVYKKFQLLATIQSPKILLVHPKIGNNYGAIQYCTFLCCFM